MVIGNPAHKLMRAAPVGGTGRLGGAGQRSSGRGAASAGGHATHAMPGWAGRARQGRSADEPEPSAELGAGAAAVEGTVFDARAALFWAAASGVVPNSVRDALVEQAASTRTAS